MSATWTSDFKGCAGQWPTEEAARAVTDSLKDRVEQSEYGGTLKAVTVCGVDSKPASDPGFRVWAVRGTFEIGGREVELWRTGRTDPRRPVSFATSAP